MKITVLLLILNLVRISASVYSQNMPFTLSSKDMNIKEVISEIENQTNYRFVYSASVVMDQEVSLKTSSIETLNGFLEDVVKNMGLDYQILENNLIVITGKNDKPFIQEITIKGKVTDMEGNPLPGVNVVEVGTTHGTITDMDGNYSITVSSLNAKLSFSFVGFLTEEMEIGGKTTIDLTLVEDIQTLDEVVVVGYGTLNRQAVTGSVIKADLETYENVAVNNVIESIKGSIAGLNVAGINTAGEVADLSIRGQNSIAAENTPLIVVDGVIFNGSLADIPTNDIGNFTVLKDASAAAVYGSRSANGVIIIETKKGKGVNGKPKFSVRTNYGFSNQLKPLEVYDGPGYLQRLLDIRETNGQEADPDNIRLYLQPIELSNYDATSDHSPTLTDPFDIISRLGSNFSTTVSVSNSTEKTNYYISTTFQNQKGVIIKDDYKHISARVNIDSDLTDWFNLGIKSSYSLRDYSGDSPSMYFATMFSPYASVYDEDGSYMRYPQSTGSFISPFWEIAPEDTDIKNTLLGTVTGIVKVPWIKGLTYHTTYSNTYRVNENFQFYNENTTIGDTKNGYGYRGYVRLYNMMLDNMVKFNRTFAEKHFVDATLLYSREHYSYEETQASAEDFDNTSLGSYALENGNTQYAETGGGETNGISMMARATYTYNHKYSLTGTVRRDGYSAFSKNKKWGVFPSVGFNWNISRENFMEGIEPVNNLALRVSYGKNGNQSIDPYSTLAQVSTSNYAYYGDDGTYSTITQYISSLGNNDLSWESTVGLNFGIDFSIFGNRISGSVDGYRTKTNDLLFFLSLPTTSGMSNIMSNIGEIKNKGFEINLHTLNIDNGDFKWLSDFVFSLNRNKVETILGEDTDGDGIEDDLISDGYFIGKSLGTIYSYKVIGMWQQEDEDNGTIMNGMRPGDYMLEDINGDGAITSDEDRQFIGNTNPNFRWSWTNTFKYKQLSLMMYFYSIWGGNDWYLSENNTPYFDAYINNGSVNRPVYDYWMPTNTDAKFPRTDYYENPAYTGTKYIDRSFIKLQKVSLGYDITKFVKPWGINGLNLSLSANNLFTYAPHWEGLDPETDSGLTRKSVPSIRTYTFSVALNF